MSDGVKYKEAYTIGCFDLFHHGHINLLLSMHERSERIIIGLLDGEAIKLLKGRYPIDDVTVRMNNLKAYVDEIIVIPSADPLSFLYKVIKKEFTKDEACFMRGDDVPDFIGRSDVEKIMSVRLFPYTHGVSSTILRDLLNGK